MLELAAPQQQQIQRLLAQRLPHVNAIAFGSRVTGWQHGQRPKPYSDLDIALWGVRPTDDIALANLRADLEESPLPWRVDISDANDLPQSLREVIERHGVRLYGQPTPSDMPPTDGWVDPVLTLATHAPHPHPPCSTCTPTTHSA